MENHEEEGLLTKAARVIGSAAGKVAVSVGVASHKPEGAPRKGKIPKKAKSRLPRKEKKVARKTAARKAAKQ